MTTQNLPPDRAATAKLTVWPFAQEEWIAGNGGQLFTRLAEPPEKARAGILLTHGLGEHSGRYGHVAAALVARGFSVMSWDLPGHGRSYGVRGDVVDDALLKKDLAIVWRHFQGKERPLFFFAHSLGGQIVLRLLAEERVDCRGAIIASPWLRLAFDPPWWKVLLAQVALRCWPGFVQSTGNRWERMSRDREHMASFPDADLVHHSLSARMYFAMRITGERVLAEAGRVQTPLLLLHGDSDPVTSHHATCEFFEHAGSADKTLRIYPGALHETHNDLDRALVLREVIDWIEARLAP
jgi:alpha-beta hydrolase superfamily lysophospholipase